MEIRRLATQFQCLMMALVLISVSPWGAMAQDGHSHATTAQPQQLTPAQGALLKIVRDNTERFRDVSVAEAEGYSLLFGCVSGPDAGAMGLHYVNLPLVAAGVIDATRPQIVIYEPMPDGHLQLIGADFLVIASDWDKAHSGQPPRLMGQLFHYFESPIALASQRSTRFMCGHGRRIPTAPS
jgi:hypothetical protein